MAPIGLQVYLDVAKLSEQGKRAKRVLLPPYLFVQLDSSATQLFRTLRLEVISRSDGVNEVTYEF